MPDQFHAVVYIDHKEALIFELGAGAATEHRVVAKGGHGHVHHKAGTVGAGHESYDKDYFKAVAAALETSQEILIVGHGTEKTQFAHFLRDHVPSLAPRVKGVESMDQPSHGEIAAYARKFFKIEDRLGLPQ
jgi:stalled ribosome rescue protein Dom34